MKYLGYLFGLFMVACFAVPLRSQTTLTAQPDSALLDIHFRLNSHRLDLNYLDNHTSLLRLQRLLTPQSFSRVDSILVVSESSPEGDTQYNFRLSERRARAMNLLLQDSFPTYTSRLRISPHGESWIQLADRIRVDRNLSAAQKDELQQILSAPKVETRKAALRSLAYYGQLKQDHYRFIRNSRIYIYYRPLPMLADTLLPPPPLQPHCVV